MGGDEQEFCHTFYQLGDGGCLAFFQFANQEFSEKFAPPPPPSLFRHVAMLVTTEGQAEIQDRAETAGLKTMMMDHGYCRSLYFSDPNGLYSSSPSTTHKQARSTRYADRTPTVTSPGGCRATTPATTTGAPSSTRPD